MTRSLSSQVETTHEHGSRLRAVKVVAVALFFLPLAYAGIQGQRQATRQAKLDVILFCRDNLQEALDARRGSASGPAPKRSARPERSPSPALREWAAKLKWKTAEFRSTYVPASGVEDLDLRLSEATLAIAEHRFADALSAIKTQAGEVEAGGFGRRDRRAEILRVRADASYDTREWAAALDLYRQLLLRRPDQLSVVERVAECLNSLQQVDQALRAYADLAKRLQDRGTRVMAQLDFPSAVRDLNKAATIRLWLFEHGRRDLAADLAQSFSSCAQALVELRRFDLARVYLEHAINLRTQLITRAGRNDLAGELASDQARYAGLPEPGEP